MDRARMLAYVTGPVDQELLARNEYLTAENRIVKAQLNGRLKLSDAERSSLVKSGIGSAAGLSPRNALRALITSTN
jgi:putative transposase